MMRDLKADKEICERMKKEVSWKAQNDFIMNAPQGWPEAINRAIKAEEESKRLGERHSVTIDKKTQVIVDKKAFEKCVDGYGALTEENDLQRASIQQLSAQVVHYKNEADGLNKQLFYLNESTKETVNRLSAQVVALRDGLKYSLEQWAMYADAGQNEGHYLTEGRDSEGEKYNSIRQLLSSPDPGEKYREKMAKMQAVVDAAKDIEINIANIFCEDPGIVRYNQLKKQTIYFNKISGKALSALEAADANNK